MGAVARRAFRCATAAVLLLSAGCSGSDDPVVQVATPPPPPPAAATTPASSSSQAPPPAPATGTKRADASPAAGTCGTVTAASGLTLRVLPAPGVSCPDAVGLVSRFQAQLAGRQPARSSRPASATVDGWLCVSGPPSAQGGTTCSLQDKTVFAAVAAE
jgi:hypothetical protein